MTRLMAPITPFITERVWQDLVVAGRRRTPRSRCTWPPGRTPDAALIDPALSAQMALVRRLVELGRAARAESGVKTRQPLSRALVVGARASRRSPRSCWPRSPTELNVASLASLSRGRRLAGGHHGEGQLPGAGQAVRQGGAGGGRGGRRRRRGGAVAGRCATGTATVDGGRRADHARPRTR